VTAAATPVPLEDRFGRVHRDLRISVTDRCNLRCTYCMPEEGLEWLDRADVLTFEEIERLARLFVERFGFDSIRLTGGEPTVRAHLPVLVEKLARLPIDLALTTNGVTLGLVAHDLAAAGLRRVNVSLDSLRRSRVTDLTRRDVLDRVLEGIDAAIDAGLSPVKVNAVVVRGVNDDEIVDLAAFGRDRGAEIRFIEFMPLDADGGWKADQVVPAAEIVAAIGAHWPLEPVVRGHEPAQRWRYTDGRGQIGVIPSVTDAFCGSCDRVRLTADGQLRSCLFAVDETDLRAPMRAGATDDELAALVQATVAAKWAGHGIAEVSFSRPRRSMSQIGG
jgi:cyclic pyranopterin phosphate synthase